MKIDEYNRVLITETEAINSLYSNGLINFENLYLDDNSVINRYNNAVDVNADTFEKLSIPEELAIDIANFDLGNQRQWFMPDEYYQFDIESWLYDSCNTDTEILRVNQELELYSKYQLLTLLKYLKFLVDTLRTNQIVWGVGRGSSICSFVLYLIGINRINPLKYNLDINEFLK